MKVFAGRRARLFVLRTVAVPPYMTSARYSTELIVSSKNTYFSWIRAAMHNTSALWWCDCVFIVWHGWNSECRRFFWQLTCLNKRNQASSLKNATPLAAREYPQYRRHLCFVTYCQFMHWRSPVWRGAHVLPAFSVRLFIMARCSGVRNIHYSVLCWYSWLNGPRNVSEC